MLRPVRVSLALLICSVATVASAAPSRLHSAQFAAGCTAYTVTVTGEGLTQPNAVVSYNITLTPRSGEPMTVVDSFVVTAGKDGKFQKTVKGTWKQFEFSLTNKYTLSGSAILVRGMTLLHTLPISFSPANLNCG